MPALHSIPEHGGGRGLACLHNSQCNSEGPSASAHNIYSLISFQNHTPAENHSVLVGDPSESRLFENACLPEIRTKTSIDLDFVEPWTVLAC